MNTIQAIRAFFLPIIATYPVLLYLGTYLSIIFLGNVISFTTVLLAFQGGVRFWPFAGIIFLVILADVSGDLAWYWLGRKLRGTKIGEALYRKLPRHEKIEKNILKNSDRWVFLSKFIPFSTFTIIFLTGWIEVPFKKFFRVSLVAIVSSVAALVIFAFVLSLGLSSLEPIALFKQFERLLALGILVFIIFNLFLAKLFRRVIRWLDSG